MSKVICICSTPRDHRELAALANVHTFLHHDYASALEDLSVDEWRTLTAPMTKTNSTIL